MGTIDLEKCPTKIVALVLGITIQTVRVLFNQGVFEQTAKGKYDLIATAIAYRKHVEQGRRAAPLAEENVRLRAAQTKRLEIANAEKEGSLLPFEDVQLVINEMMAVLASSMDGLGGRLAGVLASMTDPAEIRKTILYETRSIRAAAADRLALLGAIDSSGGDPKAPARTKSRSVGRRKKKPAKNKRRARAVA